MVVRPLGLAVADAARPEPGAGAAPLFGPEFLAALARLHLRCRRRHSARQPGRRLSTRRGAGSDFADYREFAAGDDPRQIDWALYGRTDRLFVRLYEEEGDLTVHLLIDCSRSMSAEDPPRSGPAHSGSKTGRALRFAAATAHVALRDLDRVQAHFFDRRILRSSRVFRGSAAFGRLLDFLAPGGQPPQGAESGLAAAVKEFCETQPGAGLCILISDMLDPGWQRALLLLQKRRHDAHVVQICGAGEETGPPPGEYLLADSETGEERSVRLGKGDIAAYIRRAAAFRSEVARFCAACGIGCVISRPGRPFEETAFQLLAASGLAGRK